MKPLQLLRYTVLFIQYSCILTQGSSYNGKNTRLCVYSLFILCIFMHNRCQTLGIKRFAGSDSFAHLRLSIKRIILSIGEHRCNQYHQKGGFAY